MTNTERVWQIYNSTHIYCKYSDSKNDSISQPVYPFVKFSKQLIPHQHIVTTL